MPDVSGDGDQWSLLIPVKRLDRAKTRLRIAAGPRADLALAMARDTVSAALACPRVAEVVIITDDARAGDALVELGCRIVADAPDAGLNPALVHGASVASLPQVAALSSDLPALRTGELADVLRRAAAHRRSVVADASGSGTTLLAARSAAALSPAFGVGSLTAHIAAGAVDLTAGAGASVRHDVDDLAALQVAIDLGVGPATTRALRSIDLSGTL
jgi:2-phospho-L-lactate/phosphoenolpyruvate guanylyltransferase